MLVILQAKGNATLQNVRFDHVMKKLLALYASLSLQAGWHVIQDDVSGTMREGPVHLGKSTSKPFRRQQLCNRKAFVCESQVVRQQLGCLWHS